MSRTIYSLLVGIDSYPTAAACLQGCVNDITRMDEFLKLRIGESNDRYESLILKNEQATRQAIIDGFRNHLSKCTDNDIAVFYYSGHGSQQPSPPEFWHLEPDRLDETLVCYDSRTENGWDLADKELAQLIYEVSLKDPHILVILDSCHSGGGTRALKVEGMKARLIKKDKRERPVSTFLITPGQADGLKKSYTAEITPERSGWAILPKGRHIVLSACRSNELANEAQFEGVKGGIFSYYLLDALQRTNAFMTYRDVFQMTKNKVRSRVSLQSPQMEAQGTDWKQPFLGGSLNSNKQFFLMSHDGTNWVIDGGIIHGIERATEYEKTVFAIFPFDATLENKIDLESSIGKAEVKKVFTGRSIVLESTENKTSFEIALTYKAVLIALPLSPLIVFIEGEKTRTDDLIRALEETASGKQLLQLIKVGDLDKAILRVDIYNYKYRINRIGNDYPLVVDTTFLTPNSADLVVNQLEHIARWLKTLQLTNKLSRIPANTIQFDIILTNRNGQEQIANVGSDIFFEYQCYNGSWEEPTFKIKIKNTSYEELYFILLDLPESYGIFTMLDGGGTWLEPGQEVFAINLAGSPLFTASIPDSLYNKGLVNLRDTLKLIASTEEVDATLLAQEDLPTDLVVRRATHPTAPRNSLEHLMYRVGSRHTGPPKTDEKLVDWITTEVSFTITRPMESLNERI